MNTKLKYVKYKDTQTGEYHYELTFPNGNKHMVPKEVGDYIHHLEKSSVIHIIDKLYENDNNKRTQFEIEETLRNEMAAKEELQRRNNIMDKF